MPDRIVRFTDQFFDRLDSLFPSERQADGEPSVTDFLLLDIPSVRDALADDFEGNTVATDDPDVRVYVSKGLLVRTMAAFAALGVNGQVEVFWLSVERNESSDDS